MTSSMTPLEELAAYIAARQPRGPEEYLRLARLCLHHLVALVDEHEALDRGAKWRLLHDHPAGLDVLARMTEHAEAALVEEFHEAYRKCYEPASSSMAPGVDLGDDGLCAELS